MVSNGNGGSREAILQAALKVISRLGYADASVGAIAKEARVNNVTIYRQFTGKENLFREVVGRYSAIVFPEGEIDARLSTDASDESTLMTLASAYFEILFRNIDIMRIFIVEAPHFDFVRSHTWRIPPTMHRHCLRWFEQLDAGRGASRATMDRHAEMFLAHIARRTLEYNKHDSIWEFSGELAEDFRQKMRPQAKLSVWLLGGEGEDAPRGASKRAQTALD